MAVCWLPYFALAFPGAIWYDTVQQVLQWEGKPNAITDGAWSDQHPVFDTLIFGLFYQIGDWVGSPAFGVALYTTAITATSIAVVYVVRYLARSGASRRACLLRLRVLLPIPVRANICHDNGQGRGVPPLLPPVFRTMPGSDAHTRCQPRNTERPGFSSTYWRCWCPSPRKPASTQ